jgi:hypothetical protein
MERLKFGLTGAAREHLASGKPLTRLEAMVLFGVSNFPALISELRAEGWIIKSRPTTYAAAMVRVNQFAVLTPPKNLPTREITLTEYWLSS